MNKCNFQAQRDVMKSKCRLLFGFLTLTAFFFLASACQTNDQKLEEIQKTGYVDYGGKIYRVQSIDYKAKAVFIVEPDGVAIPVPVETVNPSKGP